MDGYDYKREDAGVLESASLMNHRFAEAFKFAFAAKTHLADEDFLMKRQVRISSAKSIEFRDQRNSRFGHQRVYSFRF